MSLRKIAKEMGISPAYLSYMVNGKRPWRVDLRERYPALVNTFGDSVTRQKSRPPERVASFTYEFVGGSARESNPPAPLVTRYNGFEVRPGPFLWSFLTFWSCVSGSQSPIWCRPVQRVFRSS